MKGHWKGVIEHYRTHLPVTDRTPVVTLLEGNTPLLRCERLERRLGIDAELYVKFEGTNPTASFKDRGMTVAISKALEEGSRAVICASTGNTSASAAAYAARAGLKAYVVVPQGSIAKGKLSQAVMHGASVVRIDGTFDQALELVRRAAERFPVTLVNSLNPYRIEGQKTAAFEVCDQLGGRAPTYHFLPVGNAGNITAYWKGYREYFEKGVVERLPRMMGFEAEGAAPIVRGRPIEKPETIATAIRIGNPASWRGAVAARDESGGTIEAVTDEEILSAYRLLGSLEGIFCEPASAAALAGLCKKAAQGLFRRGDIVVCTLTGHGLKDPDTALAQVGEPVLLPPALDRLAEILDVG
ncbi:MAG: threonine synthase [Candidatus Binatia bacterium]|nr:MAG: threonine synthase [Candidatus Binatia bacterium]